MVMTIKHNTKQHNVIHSSQTTLINTVFAICASNPQQTLKQ